MNATNHLIREHDSVLRMLKILKEVSRKLENGFDVNPADLEEMLNFLRVFVDKCHHGKEENLLFPKLVEVGIPNEGGPVGMMLYEHGLGRGFIAGFAGGTSRYKAGDKEGAGVIIENINRYAELLSTHIYKENNILYKMADMHLTNEDQQELLTRFEQLEEEVIGSDQEKHQSLLGRLEQQYLS